MTQEVLQAAAPLGQFELIYVDDGSTDLTADRIRALRAAGNSIRLLRHDRRCGKTAALITGITAARAPWIVTMDGDGQDSADDVPRLLELAWAGDEPSALVAGIAHVGAIPGRAGSPQNSRMVSVKRSFMIIARIPPAG